MPELIQKWREFRECIVKNKQDAQMRYGFPLNFSEPTFTEFMDWLAAKEDN